MSGDGAGPDLRGWRIAVTRTGAKGEALAQAVQGARGRPLNLPVIDFAPCPNRVAAQALLAQLNWVDIAIFTSVPAVNHCFELLTEPWPVRTTCIAVGPATREALVAQGVADVVCPDEYTSEGVLVLPELLDLTGKRVLIPGAPGGRDLLQRELSGRGAVVLAPMVYRRAPAVSTSLELQQVLSERGPLLLVATSGTTVEYLFLLAGPFSERLFELPMVVASERVATVAKNLGVQQVVNAGGADTESLIRGMAAVTEQTNDQS